MGTTYDYGTANQFLNYAKREVANKQRLADVTTGQNRLKTFKMTMGCRVEMWRGSRRFGLSVVRPFRLTVPK